MKGQLHMDEKRAARLLGTPERRVAVRDIEVRESSDTTYTVRGYASVCESPYEVYGGPERGGWIETVKRGAFDTTLAASPDVCFLINHDGMPLARTRSGTLNLRADNTGLESEATVDRRDPEGQALEVKMERKDLDQMSFGFRVTRQQWNEDYTERDIVEVNLAGGDVSIVNWPANPATSMSIVSARSALAVLGEMEMAELRSELGNISPDELRAAQARLGELVEHLTPKAAAALEVDVVPVVRDLSGEDMGKLARGLLAAVLGEDTDEARIEALVGNLRSLSTSTTFFLGADGMASFAKLPAAEVEAVVVEDEARTEDTEDAPPAPADEDRTEVEPVDATPSRSLRSLSYYRELYGV